MADQNPDLIIRVAASVAALQADMASAVSTIKNIEGAATATATATTQLSSASDSLGGSWVARIAEGQLLRDAIREVLSGIQELVIGIPEEARELRNLSLQTQISITDLQTLTVATKEFGVDGDQLGKALFQLSQRIAGNDASVATAYHLMGMTLDEVRAKSPLDLFLATEQGLGTLSGALQDVAAKDLYGGRLGASLIAFAGGADDAVAKAQALTHASEDSVKAAAAYADAIDRVSHSVHAWVIELEGGLAQGVNTLTDAAAKGASKWQLFKAMLADTFATQTTGKPVTAALAAVLEDLNAKATASTDIELKAATAHTAVTVALTAQQQAARFMAATELDSAKPILDWQLEYLGHLKEIGLLTAQNAAGIFVSADQLKLYEANVAAAAKAEKEAAAARLAAQKLEAAAVLETTKLWDEYTTIVAKSTSTGLQQQIAAVDAWAEDLAAKMQKAGTDTQGFYEALTAVWSAKLNGLMVDTAALTQAASTQSRAGLEETAAKAQATFQVALTHVGEWTDSAIKKFEDLAIAARQAADDFGMPMTAALTQVTAAAGVATTAIQQLQGQIKAGAQDAHPDTIEGRLAQFAITQAQSGGAMVNTSGLFAGLPHRAGGGPTAAGSPYLVGERGPELFVPQSAGSIVPNGGGGTVHNYFITQPLGTPTAIAKAVDDAVMARQRNTGQRQPVNV